MSAEEETEEQGQPEPASFEQSLHRLEEIVLRLEQGNLPLDESLSLYEEGMGAYRRCQEMLQRAEVKVRKLVETLEGELKEEPFGEPDLEGERGASVLPDTEQ